ncbi:MAG: hypothetical protein A2137_04730 [Chloroflexi bacterium RBG_16_58_8]|nr:MAG: hypothetical protein A2137_04730 [Chloroflexi bacterium RBG_16_58_8]
MNKKKLYLISGILVALIVNIAMYAYTWPSATSTLNIAAAAGDIATSNVSATQPDWETLLPVEGGAGTAVIRPNAAGDNTEVPTQYPNTGENWDKVDEAAADDSATYISTLGIAGWQKDLYNLTDPAFTGDEQISSISIYFRFAADGTHTAQAMASIKTNGQLFDGPNESQSGTTYATRHWQLLTNPATNHPWTVGDINNLQAGVTMKGSTKLKAAVGTQVYVEVNYQIPAITEGEVPSGNLFDIEPNPAYSGDLLVTVYLTNTGNLRKAYQYVNIKLYLAGSEEAEETPNYKILSMENGVVVFNLEGAVSGNRTIQVVGGSYRLISDDSDNWGTEWSITPETYCDVSQR